MTATPHPICVIGLGVVGGSLAQALSPVVRVLAWSESEDDRSRAARAGVHVSDSLDAALHGAAVVALAVPVDAMSAVTSAILPRLPDDTLVLHTCGLQRPGALGVAGAAAARVLGTHPIAGSHESGFAASRADLFGGATVWIEDRASANERAAFESVWRAAGAQSFHYCSAAQHDRAMAWLSQLPQLASTALAATLSGSGFEASLAGPGARDATRLAGSPFAVWRALVLNADPELCAALRALERTLHRMRLSVEAGDHAALESVWSAASDWRKGTGPPR